MKRIMLASQHYKYTYTFTNGDVVTTNLRKDEMMRRMDRLDTLRVLTEGYETGEGANIYRKALAAYNKLDGFTGIIRLNISEKDFLSYMRQESSCLRDRDIDCLDYYIKYQ